MRLADLGRRPEALTAIEDAVAHCRQLAEANRGAFLRNLVIALNNLSRRLSELGRPAEEEAARFSDHARRRG